MNVLLTVLRRLGTSLMLVAVLALSVSVSVIPADAFGGPVEHLTDAGSDHRHMHGDGTVHSHTVHSHAAEPVASLDGEWPDFPPLGDQQDHEHPSPSSYGPMIAEPLLPPMVCAPSFEARAADALPAAAARPFGVDPNGLRRPPRPLSLA